VEVGFVAAGDGEEFLLEAAGYGACYAFAYLDVVDGADRGDFYRGADEEDFVDDLEHFARDYGFLHRDL
jgi:hypothetical protein